MTKPSPEEQNQTMQNAGKMDVKEIEAELERLSRTPFVQSLARILDAEPSVDEIRKLAARFPDRWGQLAAIFARLAGFTEKAETTTNILVNVHTMSDLELETRLKELDEKLQALAPAVAELPKDALDAERSLPRSPERP